MKKEQDKMLLRRLRAWIATVGVAAFLLGLGVQGAEVARAEPTASRKQDSGACGVLRFDRWSGSDQVWIGTGTGTVMAVESENGRIVAGMQFRITPGGVYVLHPNQSWVCADRLPLP
jgi:hypothetical protein